MSDMKTVHEVSRITGISIRTLQYYDRIGLLAPAGYTDSGYRLYDDSSLARLQMILLFRELEFPLRDIGRIIDSPDFDRIRALEQQIRLLEMKKEHMEDLILLARRMKTTGGKNMGNSSTNDFTAFDTSKIDEYTEKARASWGNTPQWKEFEENSNVRSKAEMNKAGEQMMKEIFGAFGRIRKQDPGSKEARDLVKKLQDFITEHFYTCTDEILRSLGKMYAGGGEFTANIDAAGGEGTAEFVHRAIESFCGK